MKGERPLQRDSPFPSISLISLRSFQLYDKISSLDAHPAVNDVDGAAALKEVNFLSSSAVKMKRPSLHSS